MSDLEWRISLQLSGMAVAAANFGVKLGVLKLRGAGGYITLSHCSDYLLQVILYSGVMATSLNLGQITDSLCPVVERMEDGTVRVTIGAVESIALAADVPRLAA